MPHLGTTFCEADNLETLNMMALNPYIRRDMTVTSHRFRISGENLIRSVNKILLLSISHDTWTDELSKTPISLTFKALQILSKGFHPRCES